MSLLLKIDQPDDHHGKRDGRHCQQQLAIAAHNKDREPGEDEGCLRRAGYGQKHDHTDTGEDK